ncbi:MAG TPA: twin-arginine translocase subunit TatC [Solirubrobacteraceae bacterium]|jgi:sec-independent protein translocase protein TatC|nr:twin-arginine translocase subunit TatC [Solirubrobacteraceae bacterium]
MRRSLRPIGHEDRLSLVDHLDELRTRLIISGVVLAVVFGFCFWQNHELLRIINKPLITQTRKQVAKGEGTVGQAALAQQAVKAVARDTSRALEVLGAPASGLPAPTRAQLRPLSEQLRRDIARLPAKAEGDKPVTLSVGEPFTTTLTVAFYFALVISLPVILYEVFGFVLPALKPTERRAVTPLLLSVPLLFAAGVVFGYFIVLPAAVRFFVNFNAEQFNNLVQANQFYKFAATILLAMGVVFQTPVLIIGATRTGIVTVAQLRHSRRYAIVACAAIAAFLPGDFITLLLETLPLYLLFEVSILLAAALDRTRIRRERAAGYGDETASAGEPAPAPEDPGEPTVQQIIDHTDDNLT